MTWRRVMSNRLATIASFESAGIKSARNGFLLHGRCILR